MGKWWRKGQQGDDPKPSAPPPPEEPVISLPDPHEAREALAQSHESKRRTDELAGEVREMIRTMRKAREENNFAEGIVQLIREGK